MAILNLMTGPRHPTLILRHLIRVHLESPIGSILMLVVPGDLTN
jgi:hypothetical protein